VQKAPTNTEPSRDGSAKIVAGLSGEALCVAADELLEELVGLALLGHHHAVRLDGLLDRVEEQLAVPGRDVGRVHLLGTRRQVEPGVDLGRLLLIELEALHHPRHERALLGVHVQVRPRERADEPHQAEPIRPA
jgi:hypothetical protein